MVPVTTQDWTIYWQSENIILGNALEEVLLAVDAVAPAEALVGQRGLAVAALEALAVPVSVQHLQDEAVYYVLVASRTHRDLCKEKSLIK